MKINARAYLQSWAPETSWGRYYRKYRFIMYIFNSKLMCLSKPEEVTDNGAKTLAYNVFVQFPYIINP